jgi:hypothetical protein
MPLWLAALRRLASSDPEGLREWLVTARRAPADVERALLEALPETLAEAPRSTWMRVIAKRAPQWRDGLGAAGLRQLAEGIRGCTSAIA